MAVTANIHEAKTTLSKLIERALAGEEVIIAKAGKPLVELKPVVQAEAAEDRFAIFAKYQGKVIIDERWEEPEYDAAALERYYDVDDEPLISQVAEPSAEFDRE